MAEGEVWSQLRVLGGILLSADRVAALARGLPNLQRLRAVPAGDWEQQLPVAAAFGSVTCVHLLDCCASFCSAARLSRLLPAVERLHLDGGEAPIDCDFSGLTRLTHLDLCASSGSGAVEMRPHVWDALPALTRLRRLALDMSREQLPRLARLPAGVEALCLCVASEIYDGMDFVRDGYEDGDPEAFDVFDVVEAATRVPSVWMLSVHTSACLTHAGLAWLVAAQAARAAPLARLQVSLPRARLFDIAALAVLPGLRELRVALPDTLSPQDPDLLRLIAQHARRGLRLAAMDDERLTFKLDGW